MTALRRDLLIRLGRADEALADAWDEYQGCPCREHYEDLIRHVPPKERRAWHDKALAAAEGAGVRARLDLLLEVGEIARLAELVRGSTAADLEAISHFSTEPAAEKLEKDHPDAAAILWRAQGMRIVNAGKSAWYEAAIRNYAAAKRAYLKAGQPDAWSAWWPRSGRPITARTASRPVSRSSSPGRSPAGNLHFWSVPRPAGSSDHGEVSILTLSVYKHTLESSHEKH